MEARAVHRGEAEYPTRLSPLTEAPSPLWIRGRWTPAPRAVAIVGARAATAGALRTAQSIAVAVARAGVDVVSGGAIGVDAAAHRGALDGAAPGCGHTVAVLGTGIDVPYPERNAPLFAEIVESGGALLTQFPTGSQPRKASFPIRNWVIAALADLVVVVEASTNSGTAHTVRAAQALGLPVAAVPGSPGAEGLILAGAPAVTSADDVLGLLEGRAPPPPPLPSDPLMQRLYGALDEVPRDVGDVAYRANLAVGTCAAMLVDLELSGLAARAAGGRYLRLR